ncbi:MAG: helix-turn-helix transcriptional regulator [Pseudonocardiaceae bacterium]
MAEYLTTHEVAQYYRTADATVRYWRHIGYGPRGAKIGRRVLYPRGEIERFDQARRGAGQTGGSAA